MSTLSDFLEFSPYDNKVSAEFLRDIPGIEIESDGTVNKEKAFWDKFFVEYSIVQYQNTIESILRAIKENNKHYILFIGPSGSGKTTFLNYLIKNKNKYFEDDDIQMDLVNLIKAPSNAGIGPEIIHYTLDSKIIQYLNKEVITAIAKYYVEFEKKGDTCWNIKWLVGENPEKYDKHSSFYNFISYNRQNYTVNAVRQFCREIKRLFKFQFDNLLSMIFEKAIWIIASEDSE